MPTGRLDTARFAAWAGTDILIRRLPLRRKGPDHAVRHLDLPAEGETVTVDGITMRVDSRMSPFNIRKLMAGRHTIHERALLSRHLRDDDRVLELGGGIGMVAIACAKRLGPGRVTSYEGNPEIEDLIRDNYALNNVAPDLHMAILGKTAGTETFHLFERFSHSRVGDGTNALRSVEVPVEAFATVRDRVRPSVLVADIQGAEVDFFGHADLDGIRMVLVELHPPLIGFQGMLAVRAELAAAGFAVADRAGTSLVFTRSD